MQYYWAYGANLNIKSMLRRCPEAEKFGPYTVADAALIFRSVADVTIRKDSVVPGGLWRISKQDEANLDRFEGVASGFYMKRYLPVTIDGEKVQVLFYQMKISRGVLPPSEEYFQTILRGYKDFGLNKDVLMAALDASWSDKHPTRRLVDRHHRKGQPKLMRTKTSRVSPLPEIEPRLLKKTRHHEIGPSESEYRAAERRYRRNEQRFYNPNWAVVHSGGRDD
jgi:hypothetical protein